MIRGKYYKKIIDTIENHSRFEVSDFEINTKGFNSGTKLIVKYLIESDYYIEIHIPNSETKEKDSWNTFYNFSGTVCPGPLAYNEKLSFTEIEGIYSRIKIWLDCIWEEILSKPLMKKLERQQVEINKIIQQFDKIEDDYFTVDESVKLKESLVKLEKQLTEQIELNNKDKDEVKSQISSLKNDIDTLKQTIESLKKKSWLKGFTSKVVKWSSNPNNIKVLENGYKVLKEFLPEDVKITLP